MADLFPCNPPTATGSILSESLLTPPRSPTLSTDTPFMPKDDDSVSLSMKKGRHGHRKHGRGRKPSRGKLNRACLSSEDLRVTPPNDYQPPGPYYSKSLSSLVTSSISFRVMRQNPPTKIVGAGSSDEGRRRWTLASKAAATRSRTATVSAEHRPAINVPPENSGLLSPAMITLRRATTVKTSPRKISLTFFPEPKFERSRTGFLSTFLRSMTGISNQTDASTWPRVERRRSSGASINSRGARPSPSGSATTVCTKVKEVQPTLSQPAPADTEDGQFMRRCSTKYISGDQEYEVIWDESTSTNSESSSGLEMNGGGCRTNDRRQSLAMNLLETQLVKATEQSRRQSQITREQERKSSDSSEPKRHRQGSLQSMLGFKLSRFVNEAALQNSPRSRASNQGRGKSPPTAPYVGSSILEELQDSPEFEQPACSIDFFPPLRCRATTTTSQPDLHASIEAAPVVGETIIRGQSQSNTFPGRYCGSQGAQRSPFGSMIGISSHTRRRSAAPTAKGRGRQRSEAVTGSRRASAVVIPNRKTTVEDETTPLLSTVGWLE